MRIYDFKCEDCGKVFDALKNTNKRNEPEECPHCGGLGFRVFSFEGTVGFGTFKEGHYQTFGKVFTTKHQLTNELATIAGETGKKLEEVGNDSMKTLKKPRKKPNMSMAVRELRDTLKHGRTSRSRTAKT